MPNKIDLAGQRFGRWIVLQEAGRSNAGKVMWLCRCQCGEKAKIVGSDLRSGLTSGCKHCAATDRATTHGETKTRLHYTWLRMKGRCYNRNSADFKHYGARGISICKEWKESFEAFRNWALANGYADSLSIDRIDNDGNYEPENCRWATQKQQTRNTRRNILITINGVTRCIAEWAEISGMDPNKINRRYQKGVCGEALLRPILCAGAVK